MENEIETTKRGSSREHEPKHSALEEFSRDERRPAVILLGLLALGALFFAIGILVGRFTIEDRASLNPHHTEAGAIQTTTSPHSETEQGSAPATQETEQRFTILVGTYKGSDNVQSIIRDLTRKGYTDVRTDPPDVVHTHQSFSLLVGHYTHQEAEQAASRMRSSQDQRLKNASVIEDSVR